jgi:hypothetical protein
MGKFAHIGVQVAIGRLPSSHEVLFQRLDGVAHKIVQGVALVRGVACHRGAG